MYPGAYGSPAPAPKPTELPVPTTQADVECWVEAVLRLPDGALGYLYRILHDGRGINLQNCRDKERAWKATLK